MKKNIKLNWLLAIVGIFLPSLFFFNSLMAQAQTDVVLTSVSPASGFEGTQVVIRGRNFLRCAPGNGRCNVQFFDSDIRRSTVSGTQESDTVISATVAAGLCPGASTVKVGEVNNFSNSIPFTILDNLAPQATPDPTAIFCRVIQSISPSSTTTDTNIVLTGRNLSTTVRFYNTAGAQVAIATGTAVTTYPVDTDNGTLNFISRINVTVPTSLVFGSYKIRVGTNQIITYNSGRSIQVADISNAVDLQILEGDVFPPNITNVKAINITPTSATITWDTNERSDSQVEYCKTAVRCGVVTPIDSSLVLNHSVNLTGLTPRTNYYFWVKSKDVGGNLRTMGFFIFATSDTTTPTPTPPPSADPLTISNVRITNITRDSATVLWDTNRPANSGVTLCFARVLCFRGLGFNPARVTSHSMNISGLKSDSINHIYITSVDANNFLGYFRISFRTEPGLIISNINANATQDSVTVSWNTNYTASSRLKICRFPFICFGGSSFDPTLGSTHELTVTGLRSDTRYSYQVTSVDAAGYKSDSPSVSIRTLP